MLNWKLKISIANEFFAKSHRDKLKKKKDNLKICFSGDTQHKCNNIFKYILTEGCLQKLAF